MAGNVAVRFSVQNYETVKVALASLGKDGEKALAALNAASGKPAGGLMSLSSIIEDLKGRVIGLGVSLGPAGTALVQLGPVGIAVAATLGLVAKAFEFLNENAEQFAAKGKQIKDSAQNIGVSINQFMLLRSAGQRVGMEAEQTATFLEKLTISVDELKRGSGPLFDALLRIDQGLLRELASANNTAEAIDILVRAYQRLNDQGQRNALTKAIAGRGAVGAGQLIDYLGEQNGLAGMERAAQAAGKSIDEGLLKRVVNLKNEIEQTNRKTAIVWGKLFGETVLQQQKRSADYWLSIAEAAERIAKSTSSMDVSGTGPTALPGTAFGPLRVINALRDRLSTTEAAGAGKSGAGEGVGTFSFGRGMAGRDVPTIPDKGRSGPASAAVELELMQRWTSVLGEAITPAEQMRQKVLEVAAAQERSGVSSAVAARALGAFGTALDRAAIAARTQLGIVTEEQLLRQRLKDLQELQAKGYIQNAAEMAQAERLVRKEVRETYEQQLVRASSTPALTRLSIDAQKLTENLDEGLAGALRGTTSTMIEMFNGTKTLSQGFNDLSIKIGEAVVQALLMKTIVGPLAGGLAAGIGSLAGGSSIGSWLTTVSPSARGNVFSNGSITPFANGGIVRRPVMFPMANGMGLMGEAGPEAVMPLHRLGNGKLGVFAGGGRDPIIVQHQVFNNHPTAKVSTRDEDDGRGGRRTVTTIDEAVASAVARPGSRTKSALFASGTMVRR